MIEMIFTHCSYENLMKFPSISILPTRVTDRESLWNNMEYLPNCTVRLTKSSCFSQDNRFFKTQVEICTEIEHLQVGDQILTDTLMFQMNGRLIK